MRNVASRSDDSEEFVRKGSLSVVVQGGLFRTNLVETARNCRHWRTLFPESELILSLSISDVIRDPRPGVQSELDLTTSCLDDGEARRAAEVLQQCCDTILLSPGDLPLPAFKDDSGPNNFNLQLAAAQAGLSQARGDYVLRTRSDLVFNDSRFISQHLADRDLPRGACGVFEERVMISWLFTLNPFTIERMPFHFSDWFNFGRLEDVRRLWDVPPMTLADATRFRGLDHASGSNRRERQFYSRLGIEQHLHFSFFQRIFPTLSLSSHNDTSSIAASLAILADNFTLCDLDAAGMFFEKYRQDAASPEKRFHCLTREDWLRLVHERSTPPEIVLEASIMAARLAGFL